jgi:hypothetical protein
MRRTRYLPLVLLAGSAGCGIVNVYGRVTDLAGSPIVGARVISGYPTGPNSSVTDAQGCFRIRRFTGGSRHEILFMVEAEGYGAYRGTITYPEDVRAVVRLPHKGASTDASVEKGVADPECPNPFARKNEFAVQPRR